MFPYPNSYETEDERIELTYDSRFNNEKLIFLATTARGTKILVKFTRRHSKEAHRHCAEAGVAPSLVGFQSLLAGWYMADMEYMDPNTYRVLEPEDGSEPRLMDKIQEVVKVLHNGGFVHGGSRDVNMMTRRRWNRGERTERLSTRPIGGAVITPEHDWAMVHCIFDSTGSLY